eukprot:SAG22_NODE_1162_length_5301_cov_1.628604_6_plen_172_part_00
MFWLEVFVDAYFIVDIVLNLRTGYYQDNGLLAISPGKIFKNYLMTWLLIDVASCLPITYIALLSEGLEGDNNGGLAGSNQTVQAVAAAAAAADDETAEAKNNSTKAIKILRMLRLAKLLRVLRFKRILHRYDDMIRPIINGMKVRAAVVLRWRRLPCHCSFPGAPLSIPPV